jgi:hypothetical protein
MNAQLREKFENYSDISNENWNKVSNNSRFDGIEFLNNYQSIERVCELSFKLLIDWFHIIFVTIILLTDL